MWTKVALIEAVAGFFGVSLFLYVLLGGADFGAGVLEWFVPRARKRAFQALVSQALGPVWEANHIWLIIAVVVLFTGFPQAFAAVVQQFHIPLTVLLVGIVARGCAFVFRHYDPIQDRSQAYYSGVFAFGSILAPFVLGLLAGAAMHNRGLEGISTGASAYALYVTPWSSWFAASVGVFVVVLCAYVAAVYLLAENRDNTLQAWLFRAVAVGQSVALMAGAGVFLMAWRFHIQPIVDVWRSPWGWLCLGGATLLLVPLWVAMHRRWIWGMRLFVSAQVGAIFAGWVGVQYPAILYSNAGLWSVYNSAAPAATLRPLLGALVVGCALILPALVYLFRVFKRVDSTLGIENKGV